MNEFIPGFGTAGLASNMNCTDAKDIRDSLLAEFETAKEAKQKTKCETALNLLVLN